MTSSGAGASSATICHASLPAFSDSSEWRTHTTAHGQVDAKRADLFGNADHATLRQGVELPDRCAGLDGSGTARIEKLQRPVAAFHPSDLSRFRLGRDQAICGEAEGAELDRKYAAGSQENDVSVQLLYKI